LDLSHQNSIFSANAIHFARSVFGYLPLGGAGDANISARQTSHLSGPYFQFVMRSGIIFSDQKT
jgi:hypothetical protein